MKTSLKLFALGLVLAGFGINANAQITAVSGAATASAKILTPIAVAKNIDLNFGNVVASNSTGTVVITTGGVRSTTGGVFLPATNGTVSAAKFTVTGEDGFGYTLSVPASITLTNGASGSMTVDNFTTSVALTAGVLTGGSQEVLVGATLNLAANQAAGNYTNSTDLKMTVNYN